MPNFSVLLLNFDYDLNSSVQIGDEVYWTSTVPQGGFEQNLAGIVMHVGTITSINTSTNSIVVRSKHVDANGNLLSNIEPPAGSFISFGKNNVVNNNDLTGYYTSVNFVNNSEGKVELFSVGSDVSESSK